jgi:FkbM family methyltransferase
MKIRDILFGLGIRPKPRRYGHVERNFSLPKEGEIRYAEWQEPRLLRKGTYSCEFTQGALDEARRWIEPGQAVIDIGAHVGDTTLPLAIAAGPEGLTLAVEPNPYIYPVLEANAQLNNGSRTNIVPIPHAISDRDGTAMFTYGAPSFVNGGLPLHTNWLRRRFSATFDIEITTCALLPLIEKEHPRVMENLALIKIDTEGHDHTILQTIESLITATHPAIRSEIFVRTSEKARHAYYDWLTGLGYQIHLYGGDDQFEGPSLSREDMTQKHHFDIFAKKAGA